MNSLADLDLMASVRSKIPGQTLPYVHGQSNGQSFTPLTDEYECHVFEPSNFRVRDASSQDRWRHPNRFKSSASAVDLYIELEKQRRKGSTAEKDLARMNEAKRKRIQELIQELCTENQGASYSLVGLKSFQEYVDVEPFVRTLSHKQRDSKDRRKRTVRMEVILQRRSNARQSTAQTPSRPLMIRSNTGSNTKPPRHGRQPGEPELTHTYEGSLKNSMFRYVSPHVLRDQKFSKDSKTGPNAPSDEYQPVTQNLFSDSMPLPMAIPKCRRNNDLSYPSPTHSFSSSSSESADTSSPTMPRAPLLPTPKPFLWRSNDAMSVSRLYSAPPTPRPLDSNPKEYSLKGYSSSHADYPFPRTCLPHHVSVGCQTEISLSAWAPKKEKPGLVSAEELPGTVFQTDEWPLDGETSSSKSLMQFVEDDVTSVDDSGPDDQAHKLPTKERNPKAEHFEKPLWMSEMVPVTPPASAETRPSTSHSSAPMVPIAEAELDLHVGGDDREEENQAKAEIAKRDSDTIFRAEPELNPNLQSQADMSSRWLPVHSVKTSQLQPNMPTTLHARSEQYHKAPQQSPSNFKAGGAPSVRRSASFERPKREGLRSTSTIPAQAEHCFQPSCELSLEKLPNPRKSVRFSLPPSPVSIPTSPTLAPTDSRSTSPSFNLLPSSYPSRSGARPPLHRLSQSSSSNSSSAARLPLHRQNHSSSGYTSASRSKEHSGSSDQQRDQRPHRSLALASSVDIPHQGWERD